MNPFPPAPEAEDAKASVVYAERAVPTGWKQMTSGKGIDLAKPSADVIDWNDVATALALQCRFNGAMKDVFTFYSVAQHSVLVADLMPANLAVYGLLHDAHEAYWSDDITPKKRLMTAAVPAAAEWLAAQKAAWDRAIWGAARVKEPNDEIRAAVRVADQVALAIERRDLLQPPADATTADAWAWLPEVNTGEDRLAGMPPARAHEIFLDRLNALIWPGQHEGGHA